MTQQFHPDNNLPDCMLPDGGECCVGHAAVCEDWHKQRARIEALEAALREIADLRYSNTSAAAIARAALAPEQGR